MRHKTAVPAEHQGTWVPAPRKSVVVEVYPSIFRNCNGREDLTANEFLQIRHLLANI